nr:InlB B-repeat-containing protein [Candidatus Enterousia merdequi]
MKKKYVNLFIFKLIAIVSIVLAGRGANALAGDDVACSVNREIGIQPNDSFTCSTENMEYGEPVRFTAAFCQSCYTEEDLTEFSEEKRKSVTCSISLDSEDVTSAESHIRDCDMASETGETSCKGPEFCNMVSSEYDEDACRAYYESLSSGMSGMRVRVRYNACSYTTECNYGYGGPYADSEPYNDGQPNAYCTIIQYRAYLIADECGSSILPQAIQAQENCSRLESEKLIEQCLANQEYSGNQTGSGLQEGIDYVTYDIENLTVQLPTPEKENYRFVGWCKAVRDRDMAEEMHYSHEKVLARDDESSSENTTNNETEKLGSGYRQNTGADAAGGLSVRESPVPCDNPIPAGSYDIPAEELGLVDFYAQWEPVKLQLTYHHYEKNDEQNIDVEEIIQKTTGDMCNVGDTFTPPNIQENAVPKGYKFMGWRKIKSSCKTCRSVLQLLG